MRNVVGFSQRDLASEMGIAPQTMNRFEQGLASISMEKLPTLVKVLGVPKQSVLEYLFDDEVNITLD